MYNPICNTTGLWSIVNNAAVHLIGDIELTSMEQYSKVIDTNIVGVVRVTKAFLPLLRKSKGKNNLTFSFPSHYFLKSKRIACCYLLGTFELSVSENLMFDTCRSIS